MREAEGTRPAIGARAVHGIAEIGFANRNGTTRLAHLYELDPLRVLFPQPEAGEPPQAVIVTTSGGLVAGDRIDVTIAIGEAAAAHVTASAAEKIYRSYGRTTEIEQHLTVGRGGRLEFLPAETILFDGARLRRKTIVDLSAGADFSGGEIVVFGRRARGERFSHGFLHEVWEVWRERSLLWGDALHLDGDIAAIIDDPACFGGAAGFASLIWAPVAQDLGSLVDGARAVQSTVTGDGVRAGISIVNGLLVARWLGFDTLLMRRAYADLARYLRAETWKLPRQLPRLWHV
ncbi:MAG TPA: urease accessory protein UreD [Stellaceae bacterium]|nr:urease accessory protein UreD [Stellaceae bacterium]